MTIEKFASLLGKNVVLTTPKGTVQGVLSGVDRQGEDGAVFKINVLGFILAVPLVDSGEWSLELSDEQAPLAPTEDSFATPWNIDGTGVTIEPTNLGAEVKWALFIPPTLPGHVDDDGNPVAPHGTTYWSTLTGAVASLAIAMRNEDIRFADGRVAA